MSYRKELSCLLQEDVCITLEITNHDFIRGCASDAWFRVTTPEFTSELHYHLPVAMTVGELCDLDLDTEAGRVIARLLRRCTDLGAQILALEPRTAH